MNFGHCGLMILQKLTKINESADLLRAKGYYDGWSEENLAQVVDWRHIQT